MRFRTIPAQCLMLARRVKKEFEVQLTEEQEAMRKRLSQSVAGLIAPVRCHGVDPERPAARR